MTGHQRVLSTQLISGSSNITIWTSEIIFTMYTAVGGRDSKIRGSATSLDLSFSAGEGLQGQAFVKAPQCLSFFNQEPHNLDIYLHF